MAVRATPQDLEDLRLTMPRGSTAFGSLGHVAKAMLDVARELEPGLVIQPGMVDDKGAAITQARWYESIGAFELWLAKVAQAATWQAESNMRPLTLDHADALIAVAQRAWVPQSGGPLREFPFIQHAELKRIAERAYTSAMQAAKTEDHLVTVVMAAGAVEAMLLDFLERKGVQLSPALLGKTLGQLIRQDCQSLLKPLTFDAAKLLTDHRNRIHPGAALRENTPEPTRADALQSVALLERLIEDLT